MTPQAVQAEVYVLLGLLGLAVGIHPPLCIQSLQTRTPCITKMELLTIMTMTGHHPPLCIQGLQTRITHTTTMQLLTMMMTTDHQPCTGCTKTA